MPIPFSVQALFSYSATVIPSTVAAEDVEAAAAAGLLRTIRLRAPDADHAKWGAHHVTGLSVHSVSRIED